MEKFTNKHLRILLFAALTAFSMNAYAQNAKISGKVTLKEDGSLLPGVTVVYKEAATVTGTTTDADGNYNINIPDLNGTLVFSYIGMVTVEIPINGRAILNVIMSADTKSLNEVVVMGYGTQEKRDITGSVSQVTTRELESVPVYNLEQSLKARASGVQISQNSGTPGGRIEVRIRGGNSMIGSNSPLYVVDGFPVSGGIDYLNPADIESIDILKDASATAIYGARGANGVVLVTSRRGKLNQKGRIELNSYYGVQKEIARYKMLNAEQYAVVANEWLKNQNLQPYFDLNEVKGEGTDWQDVALRSAPVQNYTLTFSGGGDKTSYSLAGNYFAQEGIMLNSYAKRGNVRLNLNHQVKERITLGVNLTVARNEINSIPVDNSGYYGITGYLAAPPTVPVYDENGVPTRIEQAYTFVSQDMQNPLVFDRPYKNRVQKNSILGNTTLEIKLVEGLTFKTLVGIEYQMSINESFTPIIYSDNRGEASDGYSYTNSFLNENIFNYAKTFNQKHKLNLVAGVTYQSYLDRFSSSSVSGLANNITENYNLGSASIIATPSNGISEWFLLSGLGRVNYSYNDKYMVTASMRVDGSSRFGANNKWGYFPSGALAWRISEEPFIKNLAVIYGLKLRTSYGITGNTALSPYQSLSRLSSVRTVYGNNTEVVGYVPNDIANPGLKWETTAQFDIGFDLSLLKGALAFTFDYYKKSTTNLLASVPLPTSTGFSSVLQNVGEIDNQGLEFSINANILRKKLKWDVFGQISANKNKIVSLSGDRDIQGASLSHPFNASVNIARVGEPFGSFYGLKEDGLTEDGFVKYIDTNNDGFINNLDRVLLGSPNPDFIYGLNNNFSYGNFDLNIFLEGVHGNEIFWATSGTHLNSFQRGHNQFADLYGNYWTKENPDPNAKYPKVSSATTARVSDRYVKDGSYLRLKSVTLNYNIPVKNIAWLGKAQVYVSATNLLTFTKYPGLDPEVNTTGTESQNIGSRLLTGIDQSAYPNSKTMTVGARLHF